MSGKKSDAFDDFYNVDVRNIVTDVVDRCDTWVHLDISRLTSIACIYNKILENQSLKVQHIAHKTFLAATAAPVVMMYLTRTILRLPQS